MCCVFLVVNSMFRIPAGIFYNFGVEMGRKRETTKADQIENSMNWAVMVWLDIIMHWNWNIWLFVVYVVSIFFFLEHCTTLTVFKLHVHSINNNKRNHGTAFVSCEHMTGTLIKFYSCHHFASFDACNENYGERHEKKSFKQKTNKKRRRS